MSRPTLAEIDLAALQHNFRRIQRAAGPRKTILTVVKADAYGHGADRVAPLLAAAGADQFAVATVDEGVALRRIGIIQPVVVMGGVFPGEEDILLQHAMTAVVYDLDMARRLDRVAGQTGQVIDYHLKVDTGMGRLGFRPEQLDSVLPELKNLSKLQNIGLMSHLATADEPDRPVTDSQLVTYREILTRLEKAGFSPRFRHIANSAAIHSRQLEGFNLVRPGIALYGGLTGPTASPEVDQRPVMRLLSAVAQVREVPSGTGISYGHRFTTGRPSRLAAVPIGYADGYNRLLSNRGEVLIGGRRVPVVGTVCMDWIMVDVTDLPGVQIGDRVVLLGRDGDQVITAEEWAEKIGTITYEVFCGISKRVPRVYVDSDRS